MVLSGHENIFLDGECLLARNVWRNSENWQIVLYNQSEYNVIRNSITEGRILRPPACMPKYNVANWLNQTSREIFYPLQQTINISPSDVWYVDEKAATLTTYVSYQVFIENFITAAPPQFYLEAVFRAASGMELSRTSSEIVAAVSGLAEYLDVMGLNQIGSGTYAWRNIAIPRGTRNVDFILWSYGGGVIGYDEIFGVMHIDGGTTRTVEKLNLAEKVAFWIVSAQTLIIPLLLYFWTKRVLRIDFPAPIDFSARQPHYGFLLTLFSSLSLFLFLDAWAVITYDQNSIVLSNLFPKILETLRLPLVFMYHGALFYPILLCYQLAHATRVAGAMGAIACLFLLVHAILQHIPNVISVRRVLFGTTVLVQMPGYVSQIILALYFVRRVFDAPSLEKHRKWLVLAEMEELYVKLLFAKNKQMEEETRPLTAWERIWLFITCRGWRKNRVMPAKKPKRKWHERLCNTLGMRQDIRIPFSVMAMLIMNIIMMYQVILYFIRQAFLNLGSSIACNLVSLAVVSNHASDPIRLAREVYIALVTNMLVSCIGGGIACIHFATLIIRRYTKDILLIRGGNYHLFVGKKKHNRISLNDSIGFVGIGVGFGLFGCFLLIAELFLIGSMIIAIHYVHRLRSAFIHHVLQGTLFWSIVIAYFVYYVQRFITHYFFEEREARFCIKRRGVFFHYSYFMTFADFSIGLTSYIFRFAQAILNGPFFSTRPDRNLERWDARNEDRGFRAYLGVLLLDHHINNPILLTFCEILLQKLPSSSASSSPNMSAMTTDKSGRTTMVGGDAEEEESIAYAKGYADPLGINEKELLRERELRRKWARNRWFVAFTLIFNPSLRKNRWQLCSAEELYDVYTELHTPRSFVSSDTPPDPSLTPTFAPASPLEPIAPSNPRARLYLRPTRIRNPSTGFI
ncbi:uncharacterized protein VTP21DRAFT_2229 [Calcarisporiella thermophila]|uniref:uncharacterized protein n=1 Tax=Calcarisporiella thermophila TaxID=911321 RepID=UPI003742C12F